MHKMFLIIFITTMNKECQYYAYHERVYTIVYPVNIPIMNSPSVSHRIMT